MGRFPKKDVLVPVAVVILVILAIPLFVFADQGTLSLANQSAAADGRINDDIGTAVQYAPRVAISANNYAVSCWQDNRTGKPRVYGQRFGQRGIPVQKNFAVAPFDANSDQLTPDIAIDDLGHFVVVWTEKKDSANVYARIYGANAVALTSWIKVNDRAHVSSATASPRVAMNGSGEFVVTWVGRRTDMAGDVFAQRFDRAGERVGGNFVVPSQTAGPQDRPDVAIRRNGSFVIVWEDGRDVHQSPPQYYIFAHVYDSTGASVGGNFKVSSHPGGTLFPRDPAIALQPNGHFFVCWSYGSPSDVYGHLYDASRNTIKGDFILSALGVVEPVGPHQRPDVGISPGSGYAVLWESEKTGDSNIYVKMFTAAGAQVGEHLVVNESPGQQTFGSLAISGRGLLLAVWQDDRNGNPDVYGNWRGLRVPNNVVAGSGFYNRVPLSWDHLYGKERTKIYKIWRSTGLGAPITQIATVDLSARGAAGYTMRDYIDFTAINGQTYLYRIEADDPDSQGPSAWVRATPSDSGHVLRSTWNTSAPAIDGVINAAEWSDAAMIEITCPFVPQPVQLYVKNDSTHLYLAVDDPNDVAVDPANTFNLAFDLDHSGRWDAASPSKEGFLQISTANALFAGAWGAYPASLGADAARAATGIVKAITTLSGHVQYEMSLDFKISPIKAKAGATLGASLWISDPGNHYFEHSGYPGEWPYGFVWEAAESMGDLVLATAAEPDTIPEAILVTNTNNIGPGSLRQAIHDANMHAERDLIHFNIPVSDPGYDPGTGMWTIRVESPDLQITDDETIIDGTTQKKYLGLTSAHPVIVLQGTLSTAQGLTLGSSRNVVTGLTIRGFNTVQIYMTGHENHVYSCYIGTDYTGLHSERLGGIGISIEKGDYNEIGGALPGQRNIVSGLTWDAIELFNGACHNMIRNNYIGVNSAGSDTLANSTGVTLYDKCNSNTIGPGNLIAGNSNHGIRISKCDSNRVIGNYIGLDPSGTLNWGNHGFGIMISQGASHTIVGGSIDEERNYICGNQYGIQIYDAESEYNQIIGNHIGVDVSGAAVIGNRDIGVSVNSAVHTVIGGATTAHGNVIGGNGREGILLDDARSTTVASNIIGTNRDGTLNLGNLLDGIFVSHNISEAHDNILGPGNLIAFNADAGIRILWSSSNRITQNSIYGNVNGGILLLGGNLDMPAPIVATLQPVSGMAAAHATVEIFCGRDAQGETWLGTVTADGSGQFSWNGPANGAYVTATATDAAGNTSPFSVPVSTTTSYVVTNTNNDGPGSLRQALLEAQFHAGSDTVVFQIPLTDAGYDAETGVWTIRPLEGYYISQSGLLIDGHSQAAFLGFDSNPSGPEIAMDGSDCPYSSAGIGLSGDHLAVRGMAIHNFDYAQLYIFGTECEISGCYIGIDATGRERTPRSGGGIFIQEGHGNIIGGPAPGQRNVISGLSNIGIGISGLARGNAVIGNYIGLTASGTDTLGNKSYNISVTCSANTIGPGNVISGTSIGINFFGDKADSNRVIGNLIGTDATGTLALGNKTVGIYFSGGPSHNVVGGETEADRNIIAANPTGISIEGSDVQYNQITGNYIGTDITGIQPLPNRYVGIRIHNGAHHQQIGPNNIIAYHPTNGILLYNPSTANNTITRNQIYGNEMQGILIQDQANADIQPPLLTGNNPVMGTAAPFATVEIYSGADEEGRYYEATVTADASGQFTWSGSVISKFITATATDADGNTSVFSVPLSTSVAQKPAEAPQQFALHANYPNPFNPRTTISYDLPRAARVRLTVYDVTGQCMRVLVDERKQAGAHRVLWDATNETGRGMPSGMYFYRIEAKPLAEGEGSFTATHKMLLIK